MCVLCACQLFSLMGESSLQEGYELKWRNQWHIRYFHWIFCEAMTLRNWHPSPPEALFHYIISGWGITGQQQSGTRGSVWVCWRPGTTRDLQACGLCVICIISFLAWWRNHHGANMHPGIPVWFNLTVHIGPYMTFDHVALSTIFFFYFSASKPFTQQDLQGITNKSCWHICIPSKIIYV